MMLVLMVVVLMVAVQVVVLVLVKCHLWSMWCRMSVPTVAVQQQVRRAAAHM